MSGERLSAATRALLKGARSDAPGAAARAKVWSGVSATVGGAAATGAGASGLGASGAAGMSAAKMLVAGTLLGGVVTVGLAAMLLHVGPSPSRVPPASAMTIGAAAVAAPEPPIPAASPAVDSLVGAGDSAMPAMPGGPVDAQLRPGTPQTAPPPAAIAGPHHNGAPRIARPAPSPHQGDDALTREASLVAGARAALARGNAEEALRLVRSARSMPSPQLVPEELTVETQALRSLGKADEARGVDATLHSQYPDSALAR